MLKFQQVAVRYKMFSVKGVLLYEYINRKLMKQPNVWYMHKFSAIDIHYAR